MDLGAAYEGGDLRDTSLEPPVRSPRTVNEIKDMNAADRHGSTMSSISESISEQLYHATISNTSISSTATILDSGCTRTMWRDIEMFDTSPNYQSCHIGVRVGDGHTIMQKGWETCPSASAKDGLVVIPGCLWVPDLKLNLVSVSHLDSEGFSTRFDQGASTISFGGEVVLTGEKKNNLYYLDFCRPTCQSAQSVVTPEILHKRLGHFAIRRIRRMGDVVEGLNIGEMQRLPDKMNCDSCVQAKSKRATFPPLESKTNSILELLHMDLAGPAEVEWVGGKHYMLIIADDFSRYYHTVLLAKKSVAMQEALKWIALQERRTGLKVKRIRSDNGGEFLSNDWTEYYTQNGIMHERTIPYSPEQNGKAERAVGIVKDGIRTYLIESGLSRGYWGAAAMNFTHTRNMIPTTRHPSTTAHTVFFGIKPDVSRLRAFGCVAYVHIPKQQRKGAWAPRARRVLFIGYGDLDGRKASWVHRRRSVSSVIMRYSGKTSCGQLSETATGIYRFPWTTWRKHRAR